MSNHLSEENSPYLLQHSENPVDWYPWGEAAFEKAHQEDKPIFLSIGYAACHWCHVMAHESFEDPETAQLMNNHFVNIKVDREERPDLDNIYMNAVVAMTGQGGWPMSVFLTPEGKPFFGGTYFPPVRRFNMPAFSEVLASIAHTWQQERERILEAGQELTRHLKEAQLIPLSNQALNPAMLEESSMRLAQSYDWENGGWGKAPKFPQPMAIEFLLRRSVRGDKFALEIAIHALKAMSKGGMYDVVGGGFARYSTDDYWRVPHFEKMLYDNAQLALVYLHAYMLTKDEHLKQICEETLDFMVREFMNHTGSDDPNNSGFFSSLDADSEGVEGKYYVWSLEEIQAALQNPEDEEFIFAAYQVNATGNFEGKTVLQRALSDSALAQKFGLQEIEVRERLSQIHHRLLEDRQARVHPGTDDKVLVAWNGLALRAFAEAARYLGRRDYLDIARRNADFLLTELNPNDQLFRSWRQGKAKHSAFLEDYASLILGLLALYQTDPDAYWFSSAQTLLIKMIDQFKDPSGGFFDTGETQEDLLLRPKDIQDNATPSGNSLAATALLQLAAFTGNGEWRELAENMLGQIQELAARHPTAFSNWLCAIDFVLSPVAEIAVIGEPDHPLTLALLQSPWSTYRPNAVLAYSTFPPSPNDPPLLQDRPLINNLPTAYVCQNFVCRQPVNSLSELLSMLDTPL